MKPIHSLIALTLAGTLSLVGCGSTTNSSATNSNQGSQAEKTTQSTANKETSSTDIKAGVTKMLSIATDLKKQIDAGDEAKIKVTGPQLEDTWHTFEDSVKPKYPDLYENVEKYLDPTVAGSKANPIDKKTLANLDEQLIQVLNELEQKAK
ncbi:hypothetical protein DNHGIG_08470 [Collibacillus ludicampi]|uniref:Lipoprotein n=1 Tax=Collibacillus ludicampi TaxID=2771369 RepID=A0AAV4LCB6_9BACL|nr:hypothetical protein [Collibacillus ludicampi]GIM45298.1 hypothetical protein DNHGIG_08470 [Collibacillus ludicampi]